MGSPHESPRVSGIDAIASIRGPARVAERRIRTIRAVAWGLRAFSVALVLAILVVVFRKAGLAREGVARIALAVLALGTFVVAVLGWTRKLPPRAGAVALDRHHGLHDRLSSALAFVDLPGAERTDFMDAAIADAVASAPKLDPKAAVPFRRPDDTFFVLGFAALLGATMLVELRRHEPVIRAATIDAVDVTPDDLDAMRDFLKQMEARAETDDAKAAVEEFNQLVSDLAAKRLDRTEAFRRMQSLEDRLMGGSEADKKAFEAALANMGEELKKSELGKKAGEALEAKDLRATEAALKELAKKLRDSQKSGAPIDKAELQKLREAVKRAADAQDKRRSAVDQRREELKRDLLAKKQQGADAGANEEEKSLLKKKERELERLEKEHEAEANAGRQLDRLDRELAQAAEDLMKDLGLSAQDLERGAEDVNRMAREAMSQEEKEELRQKLQELRETMRREGQGGQQRVVRMKRFQDHARGGQGQKGSQGQGQGEDGENEGQAQNGEGQDGEGQDGEGQDGEGQKGQGSKGSQGSKGQGQGGQGGSKGQRGSGGSKGDVWVLGPNGEKIMMLSAGSRPGSGQGSGPSSPGGSGEGGRQAGTGHDGDVQGKATNPKMGTQDSHVEGQDTGQGGSRSQVILGAAERGFSSRAYTKVYREYHTVAEEALDKDDVPGGYRFYVRRYFQLIRPREDQGKTP
ncbi:MAG: hypothetical protein U0169_05870 [Polyangiaceae bacterium]